MTADIPVYFDAGWDVDNKEFLVDLKKQTPDERGSWGRITSVDSPEDAEVHVAINRPTDDSDTKLLLFTMEPPPLSECDGWDEFDSWRAFPTPQYSRPQEWWIEQTYDELKTADPPEKSSELSWITSDKGLQMNALLRRVRSKMIARGIQKHQKKPVRFMNAPTDGHILRMNFYTRLQSEASDLLELYGRGVFNDEVYRGEVADKYDGLEQYRYSLAIENYQGPNYWSEKIGDALLAWCMPIYWGCTNLEEYLPEDSFVRVDIESDNAVARVREIVNSDYRERNIDAIREARRRIIDEYQIWPVTERAVLGEEPFKMFD